MKTSFFKIILWGVLVAGGFWAGSVWEARINTQEQFPAPVESSEGVATTDAEGTGEEAEVDAYEAKNESVDERTVSAKRKGLKPYEEEMIRLFEDAAPSVCFITTSNVRYDFFSRRSAEVRSGSGSGFIWDKQGHIITNFHVIQDADRAQVTLGDRSTWDAKLVGYAPGKDLAVLRIEAPAEVLQPIRPGRSDDLRVGQSVFAIGNPFGLDQTLTTGIISALGREIESVSGIPIRDVIQTDAAINPGNYGGPLLNSSGDLIGVNTAIYSPSGASAGIGFSIPVDVVKWAVPELIEHGRIMRPSLGVELVNQSISRRLGIKGALILDVEENSSASEAGIRPTRRDRYGRLILGDVIVEVNGERIVSNNDLILALEQYKPGDLVTLTLLREEEKLEVELPLIPAS
jgi:S1-C subfamily serine protease